MIAAPRKAVPLGAGACDPTAARLPPEDELAHLQAAIDLAPVKLRQIIAIGVIAMISALDGFDVLSVTFAAPGVVREFGIDKAALGVVLSGGLAGMAAGSLLLAPLADRFGRRPLIVLSLSFMAVGMFASASAADMAQLTAWRILTGLGIGTMVATINPLAAEYANARRRDLAIAVMAIGYPVGGVLGGMIAAQLLPAYGWRSVFLLGAGAAAALLPLVAYLLPESLPFLLRRRPQKALSQINVLLEGLGHPGLTSVPYDQHEAKPGWKRLFDRPLLTPTLVMLAVNFLYVVPVYFFLSWLPQMVVEAGFSPAQAADAGATANLAGVVGGVLLGAMTPRFGLKPLVTIAMLGMGLSMALFGVTPERIDLLKVSAGLTGFFLFSGVVGIYGLIARAFPPQVRATGAGFVIGFGRGGSALAPIMAGALFAMGFGRDGVSITIGMCAVLAALILAGFQLPTGSVPRKRK